jgi:hypothetical protein
MKRRRRSPAPDVVTSVERQTQQAEALAGIAGQARLLDPRLNPAVRQHADLLRDEQHRQALNAEHSRLLRRHRVTDRQAEDAERTLEVLRAARQMASPARSVLALHTGRGRYLRVSLAASLLLAAGAATGTGALAQDHGASAAVGWIAEVGLTGLSTMAVLYRGHLAEHGGQQDAGEWQARVLWLLMVLPLMASIAANAASHGVVGVACSVGSAAFSLFSYVISDRSGAALQARAARVTGADEARLHAVATGEDLFAAVSDETPAEALTEAEREAEALSAEFAAGGPASEVPAEPKRPELFTDEALWAWMNEPPEAEGGTSSPPPPDSSGPQGARRDLPASSSGPVMHPRVHIDGEQRRDDTGGGTVPPGVGSAAEARRAAGEQTRDRVAQYMAEHPDATAAEIAAALGVHRDTVKRHRREIRRREREGR